ncbi:hypothetical protein HYX14_04005 [Candidatus Woesearchaeota archaeon]|nr:hypothetical protein [Candidatus Woesearchaeota archaeon]
MIVISAWKAGFFLRIMVMMVVMMVCPESHPPGQEVHCAKLVGQEQMRKSSKSVADFRHNERPGWLSSPFWTEPVMISSGHRCGLCVQNNEQQP